MSPRKQNRENSKFKQTLTDAIYVTSGTLAAAVPVVGFLHSVIIKSPTEKRFQKALDNIEHDIQELMAQRDNITEDYLSKNQVFISAVLNVLLIAAHEHRDEKLQALRNIILNTALPPNIQEDKQLMFIQMVDTYSTWHIKLLHFFNDNTWWSNLGYSNFPEDVDIEGFITQIDKAFPEMNDVNYNYKVINELSRDQLLIFPQAGTGTIYTSVDLQNGVVTSFGKEFITYITSPLKK